MPLLKWVLGGLIGGLLGAIVWVAIAYLAHVEIGWVAWGMGGLVGLGVRLAAGDEMGPKPGIVAAILAIVTVYAAKYLTVYLIIAAEMPKVEVTANDLIVDLADQVVVERTTKRQRVNWPKGTRPEMTASQADFPADVWKEATARWNKLGEAEQQQRLAARRKEIAGALSELKSSIRGEAFKKSFGPLDLLWFFLATATAFKVGSGFVGESQ